MANKSTVAGDLRRFATFVKGLVDAADTLDQMQSLEELQAATEQRVKEAQATLAALQQQVQVTQAELVDVRAKAATSTRNAQTKAVQIEADAEAKAANIIEVARQSAQVQAESIVSTARQQFDGLTDQVMSLGDQLVRMREDETTLTERAVAARSELDELEAKLAAARESIAKLLG